MLSRPLHSRTKAPDPTPAIFCGELGFSSPGRDQQGVCASSRPPVPPMHWIPMPGSKSRHRQLAVLALLGLFAAGLAWSRRRSGLSLAEVRTRAQARLPVALPLDAPRVVIAKRARTLTLLEGDRVIRVYHVGLGSNPVDDKRVEGDGCTPEGDFYICTKNPRSQFHLSLGLSYPDPADAARGLAEGLISPADAEAIRAAHAMERMPPQRTALGGELFLHGGGAQGDWTWGCVAVTNEQIEELYAALPEGTPVTITR